jgi:hypothetical protein
VHTDSVGAAGIERAANLIIAICVCLTTAVCHVVYQRRVVGSIGSLLVATAVAKGLIAGVAVATRGRIGRVVVIVPNRCFSRTIVLGGCIRGEVATVTRRCRL